MCRDSGFNGQFFIEKNVFFVSNITTRHHYLCSTAKMVSNHEIAHKIESDCLFCERLIIYMISSYKNGWLGDSLTRPTFPSIKSLKQEFSEESFHIDSLFVAYM
jgi:hypothetical protein